MDLAHVELVHCNSYKSKFKGFYMVFIYEKKVPRGICKGCHNCEGELNL